MSDDPTPHDEFPSEPQQEPTGDAAPAGTRKLHRDEPSDPPASPEPADAPESTE